MALTIAGVTAAPRGACAADDARSLFDLSRFAAPEDTVLLEQMEEAIELRRREDFDRMLDARESGELIEHATLTEVDFDHRKLGIDTLFVVGDELFAYAFRPENGWGSGEDRNADGTARLRRVHRRLAGGPDAFACASCHAKGGPDGAGTQTQTAFLSGDGRRLGSADERNAPHLLGLGPVELLAAEMSAELQATAREVAEAAARTGDRVERELVAKGVSFGRIAVTGDSAADLSGVDGVDADLVVRPFGWKGHQATVRAMSEESLRIHQGLLSNSLQLAVRDGSVDAAPYGGGRWSDVDRDGVSLEIDSGMLSTLVGYLVQLEAPVVLPPRDPDQLDAFARGRRHFDAVGCASCHVPSLELLDPRFVVREADGPDQPAFTIDVARDGEWPKIEPRYARPDTPYLVHLFSDLRRHDMGPALASPTDQATIPAREFLTRPLWGLADTAPYMHDGRAPDLDSAIRAHGGEAEAARQTYLELDDSERAALRVFLASLGRAPKLFAP
jgi:hypothetical protein